MSAAEEEWILVDHFRETLFSLLAVPDALTQDAESLLIGSPACNTPISGGNEKLCVVNSDSPPGSGQITGSRRPCGVQRDAGKRNISLFLAEKFHFLVTNFTNSVIRHLLHVQV